MLGSIAARFSQNNDWRATFYPRYIAAGYPLRADADPSHQASLARTLRKLEERKLILRVRPFDQARKGSAHLVIPSGPRPDIQPTNVVLTELGMRVSQRIHEEKYKVSKPASGAEGVVES